MHGMHSGSDHDSTELEELGVRVGAMVDEDAQVIKMLGNLVEECVMVL